MRCLNPPEINAVEKQRWKNAHSDLHASLTVLESHESRTNDVNVKIIMQMEPKQRIALDNWSGSVSYSDSPCGDCRKNVLSEMCDD